MGKTHVATRRKDQLIRVIFRIRGVVETGFNFFGSQVGYGPNLSCEVVGKTTLSKKPPMHYPVKKIYEST